MFRITTLGGITGGKRKGGEAWDWGVGVGEGGAPERTRRVTPKPKEETLRSVRVFFGNGHKNLGRLSANSRTAPLILFSYSRQCPYFSRGRIPDMTVHPRCQNLPNIISIDTVGRLRDEWRGDKACPRPTALPPLCCVRRVLMRNPIRRGEIPVVPLGFKGEQSGAILIKRDEIESE